MAAGVGGALALWQIGLLFTLGKALKSMWILINALQFLVYISLWASTTPLFVRVTLNELKRVILGEFLDDISFG